MTQPFLSIYTPTYKRPKGLAACMASIQAQTVADQIQHLIVPDYAGVGLVEALYQWPPRYAASLIGDYVTFMADDDVLETPNVVEQLAQLAALHDQPDVLIVQSRKYGGGMDLGSLPYEQYGPPVLGRIDLGSVVTRRDVWLQHVQDYARNGGCYESDYEHVRAMWDAGCRFVYTGLPFVRGGIGRGAAE
jgi:glycosyltransferase involved in cell wall biosynthesis